MSTYQPIPEEGHIHCPHCEGFLKDVSDSRPGVRRGIAVIRRRRRCNTCNQRFTTVELSESVFMSIAEKRSARDALIDRVLRMIEAEVVAGITKDLGHSTIPTRTSE